MVWHTQGSGKSMEMELYANQALINPSLANPTVLVLTDRTDLDDQLYETFELSDLLPEQPHQVATRDQLRAELASRRTGGILFTTLQKFGRTKAERDAGRPHPLLSDRRNIIVIVDEAHRSHYDDLDGYARHLRDALPQATMIAFTGTPISGAERDTRRVFGDYIDIYDLTRAVDDGATVPVYYEAAAHPGRPARRARPGGDRRARRRGDLRSGRLRAGADPAGRRGDERAVRGAGPAPGTRRGPGRALGGTVSANAAVHRLPWQGHHRLRYPRDLRQPLRADHRATAGLARDEPSKGKIKVVYTGDPTTRSPSASTCGGRRKTRRSSTG